MKTLLKNLTKTSCNENTKEQLDYYIDEENCKVGDKAYMYSSQDAKLMELKITHIKSFSTDMELYDFVLEDPDILLNGNERYQADECAEFISDNNSYLVWFKHVE